MSPQQTGLHYPQCTNLASNKEVSWRSWNFYQLFTSVRLTRFFGDLTTEFMASQQLSESAVIRSLRRFRDTYFPNSGKVVKEVSSPDEEKLADAERCQPGYFDSLPVRMSRLQFRVVLRVRVSYEEKKKKAHASHTYGCLFLSLKLTFFWRKGGCAVPDYDIHVSCWHLPSGSHKPLLESDGQRSFTVEVLPAQGYATMALYWPRDHASTWRSCHQLRSESGW